MTAYDLYGCKLALGEAKACLEELFGVRFESRDSTYQGGEYFRYGDASAEHFVLKKNIDPFDGEPAEMKFPDYPILLYVNATIRSTELQDAIGRLQGDYRLLRHEDF